MKRYFSQSSGKLTAILGLLAVAGWLGVAVVAKDSPTPPRVSVSDHPIDRTAHNGNSFAPVVKKVAPSVVNIYSTRTFNVPRSRSPFMEDPFLRRFFGEEFGGRDNRPLTRKAQSLGSGVIVTEDGYILTNNHVVEGADKDGVKVAMSDGKTEYTARIIGTDPQTEVAVLKIEAKQLTPLTLADSDKVEVGDVVLAVGNPFGVGQSVSMGIVSGLGRSERVTDYEDFIQTDTAINPGNSGGPLVDVEGRLVGINTFIESPSGANSGVGFAISANLARSVMNQIITDGKVVRGYLGVKLQPVTADLAKEFELPETAGALVDEVQADTPAAAAGLKDGDVIVEFNGKKVADFNQFRVLVAQTAPKTKVSLKILRDGKEKNLTATLGTLPGEMSRRSQNEQTEPDEKKFDALDGVEVGDLDSRARRQNDFPKQLRGALVTSVESGSAAEEARLKVGDVILEINRQSVRDADSAVELCKDAKGDRLLLRVWSSSSGTGGTHYIVVNNRKRK
ncbi:MAG TPA: DegQ family serine endoprotease [Verrucomicrobiae bacterium]|nr:DegQ family serine endoprotease [Verrucomicrobiae bacterium]